MHQFEVFMGFFRLNHPVNKLWITFKMLTLNDPRVKSRVRVKNGQNSAKVDPP